jgi:hypothetical protein
VQNLNIGVRGTNGNNLDFAGDGSQSICTSEFTYTTNSKAFSAGTYSTFSYYEINNSFTDGPSQNLVVTGGTQSSPSVTGGTQNSPSEPTWDSGGNHTTQFVDEFNGTSLNTSVWNPAWFKPQGYTGISGPMNPGSERACENSANVTERGSVLALALTHVASSCGGHNEPWTAGLVTTQRTFSRQGGDYETRINLPCNSSGNVYAWPAWWITSDGTGEIDIMEKFSAMAAHTHITPEGDSPTQTGNYCGWHDYGVAWNPGAQQLKFYWDSTLIWTTSFTSTASLWPVLDYSINSNSIVPPSGTAMQVDWVRVWNP